MSQITPVSPVRGTQPEPQDIPAGKEYLVTRGFTAQYRGPGHGDSMGNTSKQITLGAGRFITSDPELQHFLESYPGVTRKV